MTPVHLTFLALILTQAAHSLEEYRGQRFIIFNVALLVPALSLAYQLRSDARLTPEAVSLR